MLHLFMLVIEHWVRFLSHLGLNGIFFGCICRSKGRY